MTAAILIFSCSRFLRFLTALILLAFLLPAQVAFAFKASLGADGRIREYGRPLNGLPNFVGLADGEQHALAIDQAGRVWSWGSNSAGQLGTGSFRPERKPVAVEALKKIVAVAAGRRHSVALAADGRVWSWGAGQFGQTGNGSLDFFASQPLPGLVFLPVAIKALAAGDHHTLALGADGSVWAWGAGEHGQLGDGGNLDTARPVKIRLKEPVAKIFARGSRSGAVDLAGKAFIWGKEQQGRGALLPRRVALTAAWFREALPQSLAAAPSVPAVLPKAAAKATAKAAAKASAATQAASPPKAAPPAGAARASTAATLPPSTGKAIPPLPPAKVVIASPPPPLPPPVEKLLIRGRVLLQRFGASHGLAGVEVRAGNTDCVPSDSEGWFECRVAAGFSGTLRPLKSKYRFVPSSVSLDRLQADMDSQQYFTAIYEPF
ncbi:MAG: hypothetical protein A2512_06205 [Deltaproteobacteria bacterium RIFOXYD12_FULL_56_24]|nr:MAG: hypothetical protein A2512_06205 [Deltaproteobacteria bacterium RIFOXYD12_FULL_56_24]